MPGAPACYPAGRVNGKQTLYLCMGSACHQAGGFRLISQLEELIAKYDLRDRLELKGAFCLETCMQGRSLKFEGRVLTGLSPADLERRFQTEILPFVKAR